MQRQGMGRLVVLDLARTLALLGMAAYHFTWDLQMFGLVPPGTAVSGFFFYHARTVAGSFLFLAGVSLWLAHGQGIRWGKFWQRLLRVGGAAALITVGTWFAMRDSFIFFGILHCITVSSLLGLAFLRLPALVTAVAGAALIAANLYISNPLFDQPWLWWLGMRTMGINTVDLEPLVPWFGPFLLGLATAKLFTRWGVWSWLAQFPATPSPLLNALAWPGKHSLAVYLIHQPVLIGLVWSYVQLR
ncbi:heparan-alpha-glucosaminide N-acetyltransferase [Rhodobacter ferrooxidans]|uniref:Heparan-alpha-glucosaminide N-acetyltransferase catalytic domain-containing protein n=1 Tax=Rhodobacter ferrooxidans TaxID=371731 RepID=C8S2M4_9RHOB|nr:heparan-alpha-glucosaminide N-acetyltransferase [Rhodobacter sp. SW2]EEW24700.1 protein of unknown function DUF1624 [Rhodobacter sp. SW2]